MAIWNSPAGSMSYPTFTPKAACTESTSTAGTTISMTYNGSFTGSSDTLIFSGTFATAFTADTVSTWECCMAGMKIGTTLELAVKLSNYDTVNAVAGTDDVVTITFNGGTAFTLPTPAAFDLSPIASAVVMSTQTLTIKIPIQYAMVISTEASAHTVEVELVN